MVTTAALNVAVKEERPVTKLQEPVLGNVGKAIGVFPASSVRSLLITVDVRE